MGILSGLGGFKVTLKQVGEPRENKKKRYIQSKQQKKYEERIIEN
jgi:hypothetical protein